MNMATISRNREFIRHPVDIPIEVSANVSECQRQDVLNLSVGGLSFTSSRPWKEDVLLRLYIDRCSPTLDVGGRVVWCEPRGRRYEIGVAFTSVDEAYQVRMVEQICQIEQYRQDMLANEGRILTSEEAAQEWIARYAQDFAQHGWHSHQEEDEHTRLACRDANEKEASVSAPDKHDADHD